ncbi:SAM-dependent methyltransferase [Streptomyces marispadix]|uniref:SAM-dependent methyltransferase n=1 Tax=Streptomyces marispadix TaxID=2922868 RepID=A0ABS9T056_9ACTN|nr:SAM-dependent methyltransferase [Streptomyces marispadix]MCH6161833.1 SAM-dependent methyltransferase [Streptomyces marispadix]
MDTRERGGGEAAGGPADSPCDDGLWLPWQAAARRALYGTDCPAESGAAEGAEDAGPGFYEREPPAAHFRTSVHVSRLFAIAVARLLRHVDDELGRPRELAMVDVGAGRGELLTGVLEALPDEVSERVRPYAVERAPRPPGLDERIVWSHRLPAPASLSGLLFANEWLDNVPLDVAENDSDGVPRTVLVRTSDGAERLGEPVHGPDADWLRRWWPLGADGPAAPEPEPETTGETGETAGSDGPGEPGGSGEPGKHGEAVGPGRTGEPGLRAEIGLPRDEAWAAAVRTLSRGLAVAVDYAHFRADRPLFGTLTGYLDGREVSPVPDGSRDLTAHVALDACAAAGAHAAVERYTGTTGTGTAGPGAAGSEAPGSVGAPGSTAPAVRSQRDALHILGIDGARPPLSLASSDPAAYVRQLASAGEAAELTDRGGLGAFGWLIQPVGGVPSPFG